MRSDDRSGQSLRDRLIGLGERSHRKSYYPALRERLVDLERFRALLDESQDGILLLELPEGIITDINEAGRRFLSTGDSARPGMPLRELLPPAAWPQVVETLRAMERGASSPFTLQVSSQERERLLELSIRSKGSFEGRAFAVLVIRDETERTRAVAALEESEERYRNLFQSSRDAIVAIDLQGSFTDANPAALRLLGYTREELMGLTYQQITPARWHVVSDAMLNEQVPAHGYSDEYEKEYVRKDGSTIPISVRAFIRMDLAGNRTGVWAIVRDMTERKRADEALRESEERFRVAFQTSLDAITISRVDDGIFIAVNEGFTEMTGWNEAEVLGRSSLEIHFWEDPSDRARLVDGLKKDGYVQNLEARFEGGTGRSCPG